VESQGAGRAVHAEVDYLAGTFFGHFDGEGVVGVEDAIAVGGDAFDNNLFDPGEALRGLDAFDAEVVGGDVEDNADLCFVEGETGAEDAATGGFEDGDLDERVLEDRLGAAGAGAIALDAADAAEVDAVGSGHADVHFHGGVDMGDHAGDSGLAIGARDGDERHAGGGAVGEEEVNDGFADGARFALGRIDVHAEAGGCVDFDDAAALLFEGALDAIAYNVDAGYVEADGFGGEHGDGSVVGVDIVGDVGGGASGG
jgi:hypothetical protein